MSIDKRSQSLKETLTQVPWLSLLAPALHVQRNQKTSIHTSNLRLNPDPDRTNWGSWIHQIIHRWRVLSSWMEKRMDILDMLPILIWKATSPMSQQRMQCWSNGYIQNFKTRCILLLPIILVMQWYYLRIRAWYWCSYSDIFRFLLHQ